MKTKYLLILFACIVFKHTKAQIVHIPDPTFKYGLLNYGIADLNGDGNHDSIVDTNGDGEIQVSEAEAVFGLQVGAYLVNGLHIQSLEGIEYFINIEVLNFSDQEVDSINLTSLAQLKNLNCSDNMLLSLDITQNPLLEVISCIENLITGTIDTSMNPLLRHYHSGGFIGNLLDSVNFTQNPLLEHLGFKVAANTVDLSQNTLLTDLNIRGLEIPSIDLSNNSLLEFFDIGNLNLNDLDITQNINLKGISVKNNSLTSLDISHCPNLTNIYCNDNQLTSLNIQNGNNVNFYTMRTFNNPNLTCIQVDDIDFANAQICNFGTFPDWCKDPIATYSQLCDLGIAENTLNKDIIVYPNPVYKTVNIVANNVTIKQIIIYTILGKKLLQKQGNIQHVNMAQLPKGILFIKIETDKGFLIKKVVKK